jgi:hypothetical protein
MNTHVRDNFLNAHYEYGTTLPATPSDGQLAILVDSTTAPTYRWTFRFNNSITTNKWEYIGGTAMISAAQTLSQANTTTWRFTATLLTVPRAGVYDTIIRSLTSTGTGAQPLYTVGVAGAGDDTYAGSPPIATTGGGAGVPDAGIDHRVRRTFAASDALSIGYRVRVGSVGSSLVGVVIELLPVQVA